MSSDSDSSDWDESASDSDEKKPSAPLGHGRNRSLDDLPSLAGQFDLMKRRVAPSADDGDVTDTGYESETPQPLDSSQREPMERFNASNNLFYPYYSFQHLVHGGAPITGPYNPNDYPDSLIPEPEEDEPPPPPELQLLPLLPFPPFTQKEWTPFFTRCSPCDNLK